MNPPRSILTFSEPATNFEYSEPVSFLMQYNASKRNFNSTMICTYDTLRIWQAARHTLRLEYNPTTLTFGTNKLRCGPMYI